MGKVLTNTINNIIWREVDCFTDELIQAKNVFYFSDVQEVEKLLNRFNRDDMYLVDSRLGAIKLDDVKSDDLLMIGMFNGVSKTVLDVAKTFRKNGGRVILLTNDRESELTNLANETIGVSINRSDIENNSFDESVIYVETIEMLVDHINNRLTRAIK